MPQKIEILFSSKIFRLALKIFRAAWCYIVYNIYFALCAKDRISLLSSICFNWPLPAILLSSSFNIILLVTCSSVWISNYILRSQVTLITGFGHFMLVLVTLWGPTLLLLEHTNLIPAYFQLSNGRLDYRRNTHKPLIFFHY